jgi:capsule polysaccharide export protein KpsE/RkpR
MLHHLLRSTGDETLSTAEDQNLSATKGETGPIEIPIADFLKAIWLNRRWLAKVIGLGLLVSIGIALIIPNQYTSTAQLMPPDPQSLSDTSMLSAITGASPIGASVAGGLLGTRTASGTYIGILSSQTAQDDIIDRFDLRRIYHRKFYYQARDLLTERTTIVEDKKSGIISISVTDRDPILARNIAKAYIEELDRLVNTLSTSSARRERIFLEERLKSIKSDLDASSVALSQFSSRNATLNPQTQGQALLLSATNLQSQLIIAQSELNGLKTQYSDDNVRVREARGRVDELQRQLNKMGSPGVSTEGADLKTDQVYPSIRDLPILGATYSDLYREVTMQEAVYEALNKQYELAKVEEAKEIPPIKILDEPQVPEIKSSPHRSVIVLLGILISALAGIVWIVVCKLWEISDGSDPVKAIGMAIAHSFRSGDAVAPN